MVVVVVLLLCCLSVSNLLHHAAGLQALCVPQAQEAGLKALLLAQLCRGLSGGRSCLALTDLSTGKAEPPYRQSSHMLHMPGMEVCQQLQPWV